jgi:uncharacterized protein (UPF0128 family)
VEARKEKHRVKELQSMIKQLKKEKFFLSNGMLNNKKRYNISKEEERDEGITKGGKRIQYKIILA